MTDTRSDEDARTLYVRGITDEVDEEILFELFQNAGPLTKINIPMDHQTKRKKNFCFVQFQHMESVPYAIDLFKDIKLFGQRLQMQNRTTGAGVRDPQRDQNQGHHQRTMSAPMQMPMGQFNPPFGHPGRGLVQNPFNNEFLVQQQQQMMRQRQQQMNYNRQFSDDSHDRSQNQYQQQNQQNYHQDRGHHEDRSRNSYQDQQYYDRRQQSHNREDRSRPAFDRQHSQGNDFRDRSHDRRSYDNRNSSNQHGGHHGRRRY